MREVSVRSREELRNGRLRKGADLRMPAMGLLPLAPLYAGCCWRKKASEADEGEGLVSLGWQGKKSLWLARGGAGTAVAARGGNVGAEWLRSQAKRGELVMKEEMAGDGNCGFVWAQGAKLF
ncbi:hypothetical protein H0E87_007285 [Populus deltoides]|uniref:Uncharacterized protein n=1 Tax=Populus deltoides TaxID=3696 RepID=A0A8T2ZA98_POPDE|nr:hypothetical protein H0E87_007285 [Populus deltoides]